MYGKLENRGKEEHIGKDEINPGCIVTAEELKEKDESTKHGIIVIRTDDDEENTGTAIATAMSCTTRHLIAAYKALGSTLAQKTHGLYGTSEDDGTPDFGAMLAQMLGSAETDEE